MTIALPSFIDAEAWSGFVQMRKAHKVPFTDRAAKMILAELYRIKDAGHCPNAALDQSTLHGWKDVWPARDKVIERKAGNGPDPELQRLNERARTATKPPPGLRRVA